MSTPLDPELFGPENACFGCSPTHASGLRLKFWREGEAVVTQFTPQPQFQGPPGLMHGGLVLTAADELAAWAIIALRERFGFTVSTQSRMLRPLRVGVPVEGRAVITKDSSRVIRVEATFQQAGEVAFRGELTFAILDQAGAEQLLGRKLPEAWKRFCR